MDIDEKQQIPALMSHQTFFRLHPVFTGAELTAHLASRGQVRARTQESLLAYYTRTARLLRIRRGLYAVIPAGADPDSYPVDPYLIASRLTSDSVLSHHTALEYHGRAYSVWQHLVYSTSRPLRTLSFRAQTFRGTSFPRSLRRSGKEHFGVLEGERKGVTLRVTSLERTLVDVLHRPAARGRMGGGLAIAGVRRVLRYRRGGGIRASAGETRRRARRWDSSWSSTVTP